MNKTKKDVQWLTQEKEKYQQNIKVKHKNIKTESTFISDITLMRKLLKVLVVNKRKQSSKLKVTDLSY